jgi:CubicO group peptidase (beta-lactamase class C family)
MRSFLTSTALMAVALTGPLGAQSVSPAALSEYISDVFATGAAAGVSVAVVHGDSVLLVRALGVADMATGRRVTPETRFLTASTTKAFTALTAILLDERGAVELDAPLAELLPEAELDPKLSAADITLRDLLAMRHGISNDGPVVVRTAYTGEFDTPALLRLLRHHPASASGRRFEYGNVGYNVAALALQQAAGRHWQDLTVRHVFRPLRMRETTSRLSSVRRQLAMPHAIEGGQPVRIPLYKSDRTMHAAGGHVTTARDLARFVIAHLNGGKVKGAAGVSAGAIASSQRRETDQDREFSFVHRNGWGLGLDIADYRGDTLYQRNGSFTGYYSHMSFMPSRRVGVVVLANGGIGGGGAAAETIAQGVYDLVIGTDSAALAARIDSLTANVASRTTAAVPESALAPAVPPPLSRYTGEYRDSIFGTLTLEQRGDSLVARMGDAWGVVRGSPDTTGSLAVSLMGGRRRLTFTFVEANAPATAVEMVGRTFARVGAERRPRE